MIGAGGVLEKTETRSLGGTVLIDHQVMDSLSVGVGYTFGFHRVGYLPTGGAFTRIIDFDTSGGFASILFWF